MTACQGESVQAQKTQLQIQNEAVLEANKNLIAQDENAVRYECSEDAIWPETSEGGPLVGGSLTFTATGKFSHAYIGWGTVELGKINFPDDPVTGYPNSISIKGRAGWWIENHLTDDFYTGDQGIALDVSPLRKKSDTSIVDVTAIASNGRDIPNLYEHKDNEASIKTRHKSKTFAISWKNIQNYGIETGGLKILIKTEDDKVHEYAIYARDIGELIRKFKSVADSLMLDAKEFKSKCTAYKIEAIKD